MEQGCCGIGSWQQPTPTLKVTFAHLSRDFATAPDLKPEVVHFSGHGMSTGELCFEDETGKTHPIHPDALADLFEQFTDHIKCVILNACYSEYQAKAIVKHIDYVVGMNKAIGDKAPIAFSIGFYQVTTHP